MLLGSTSVGISHASPQAARARTEVSAIFILRSYVFLNILNDFESEISMMGMCVPTYNYSKGGSRL